MRLNPHPAGQLALNVPAFSDEPLPGVQHKYPETVLVFPKQGQTCHAYCTYCFRWAQFVGEPDLKMATDDMSRVSLLPALASRGHERPHHRRRPDDHGICRAAAVRRAAARARAWSTSSRSGSAPSRWPTGRSGSSPTLTPTTPCGCSKRSVAAGKSLALMAHFSHPRELEPTPVARAISRIRSTGAVIRTQAPLIRTINDDPACWSQMWRTQLRLGLVPYYMFVERDTGPQGYFAVPLARAAEIFRDAYASVSGLCRTVRGPSMSSTPGKVCVDGVAEIAGQRVFVAAHDPGSRPGARRPAVLRPLRPGRRLALRPAAGVRRQVPVPAGSRHSPIPAPTGTPSCWPRPTDPRGHAPLTRRRLAPLISGLASRGGLADLAGRAAAPRPPAA